MIGSRKDCLGGLACQPTTLAEALHCLIEHSVDDVAALSTALAARFDVHASRAYLYELANPHRAAVGQRVLAIASGLTTITRRPVLVQFLCRAHGGEFAFLPTLSEGGVVDPVSLVAHALREFSQAMQAFADGQADGVWTMDEVERLEREGREAISSILQTIEYARRRVAAVLPEKATKMAKAAAAEPLARPAVVSR